MTSRGDYHPQRATLTFSNPLSVHLLHALGMPSAVTRLTFSCSLAVLLSYVREQLENS